MKTLQKIIMVFLLAACSETAPEEKEEVQPKPAPQKKKPTQSKSATSSGIQDPLYKDQWYLKSTGQGGAVVGLDIKIEPVWKQNYLGQGIFVGVMDDGIDENHPDLKPNIEKVKKLITGGDSCLEKHGTPCAGIIAAKDNAIGTRGVAPRAKIYFYKRSAQISDKNRKFASISDQVKALHEDAEKIAVYSCSWAVTKGGFHRESALEFYKAFDAGIQKGFNGKGSVYCFASGNAGLFGYMTNQNVLLSHRGVMAVNGVTKEGKIHMLATMDGYNQWVSAFTYDIKSPDRTDSGGAKCGYATGAYDGFSGTSAATPIVAGVVALVRQANPNLTYRDVKLILAETAKRDKVSNSLGTWHPAGQTYAQGSTQYRYNKYIGFGIVDAAAAVALAKTWTNVPAQKTETYSSTVAKNPLQMDIEKEVQICIRNSAIRFIEHLEFSMDLDSSAASYGKFAMEIVEPNGRAFKLLDKNIASFGEFKKGITKFQTSYNLRLGKNTANGIWKLKFKVLSGSLKNVQNIKMKVYGF